MWPNVPTTLFLCTGNSARILAEALINQWEEQGSRALVRVAIRRARRIR
jgi:protein-tyrosine-phosphatase